MFTIVIIILFILCFNFKLIVFNFSYNNRRKTYALPCQKTDRHRLNYCYSDLQPGGRCRGSLINYRRYKIFKKKFH